MIIYLDLDGPILDVSARSWHVYQDALTELSKPVLPLTEYWALKQRRTPLQDILARTGAEAVLEEYIEMWSARIEMPTYLAYDRVWPGVTETLLLLSQAHRLVLVTLRHSVEALHGELQQLCLAPLFQRVLSSGEEGTPRWGIKVDLIRSDGYQVGMPGMIVGDTETDILAGKRLGLQTVGVLSGIRTREHLEAAGADTVISSAVELAPLLMNAAKRGSQA